MNTSWRTTFKRALLGAAIFAHGVVWAQDEPVVDGGITVTASRVPESLSAAPPAITVVTADQIKARGATTAAEALRTVPGVLISDRGPLGAEQSVSIRGSTANEVLVLIDGVRVNNALSGLADLANVSVDGIDRIEVMREGGSALYGADAVGGVVNVVTKKRPAPFRLTLENGSYFPSRHFEGYSGDKTQKSADLSSLVDSQKALFSWSPLVGDLVLHTAGSVTRAANAYTFIDANGDQRVLLNGSLAGADGSVGATMPWWDGLVSVDLSGAYSQEGVPGAQTNPTLQASEIDSRGRGVLKYSADRFLVDQLNLDASFHVEATGLDYDDPQAPYGDGYHRVFNVGTDLQQTDKLDSSVSLVYGVSAAQTLAQSDSVGNPQRQTVGAFFEPVVEWGNFSLRPALRYDYYSDFFAQAPWGGLAESVATAYRLSETDVLKLNLSRSYRVPTFEDLYWPATAFAAGNPALKPETGYSADLGFGRRAGSFVYNATAYLRYVQDVILWQPGSDGIWRPSNFGVALYPGIEQELKTEFADHYTASVSYTFLYSYVLDGLALSDDKRLPMTPVHTLDMLLAYRTESWSWSATGKYSSLRYLTTANVTFLPDYFTLDALVRWTVSANVSTYLAVDNLFGEQYQTVEDYPMPNTKLRLGLEIQL